MMTYYKDGLAHPATVVALEEGNVVTQVKTADKDGYNAVQVGYRVVRDDKVTKPELGHTQKAGAPALKQLREFKIKDAAGFEPGQQLAVEEMFKAGDLVDIAGTSIGKGFQGELFSFPRSTVLTYNHFFQPHQHHIKAQPIKERYSLDLTSSTH